MFNDKIRMWLFLTVKTNISRRKLISLYNHFKSVYSIYTASEEELSSLDILSDEELSELVNKNEEGLDNYISILKKNSVKVLTIECDEYPEMLRQIATPPLVLYCRGKFINLNNYLCIASVGSRKPTAYGRKNTYSIVKGFCKEGCVLVSGMAQGIDAISHKAAIENGCPTVAFIANGVDIIYPQINAEIFKKVMEVGMIVSEYPLGTMPKPYYFPERNRLIAGVSKGVFISEATLKSGSSLTVSYAIEQNKDIFAMPGNVDSPTSEEPNRLIKLGAYAVTEAGDIIRHYADMYNLNMEFGLNLRKEKSAESLDSAAENEENSKPDFPEGISDEEKVIFVLKSGSYNIDVISGLTDISLKDLDMMLLMMEMNGKIKNDNGIYYLID